MDHLSLDTAKMAQIVVNGEAFEKKARNTVEHLKAEYAKIKPESPKSEEFKQIFGKEVDDIENVISKKLAGLSTVVGDMRQQIEKLENSDEIFAAARSSMKESKQSGKVKIPR